MTSYFLKNYFYSPLKLLKKKKNFFFQDLHCSFSLIHTHILKEKKYNFFGEKSKLIKFKCKCFLPVKV